MGDELELLGRMVQGCGAVGGTGEGVRVDDDEAIDTVGMREERDGAPIPGKEYQQQRSAYSFYTIPHRRQIFDNSQYPSITRAGYPQSA